MAPKSGEHDKKKVSSKRLAGSESKWDCRVESIASIIPRTIRLKSRNGWLRKSRQSSESYDRLEQYKASGGANLSLPVTNSARY
jgi:hypothetical protein